MKYFKTIIELLKIKHFNKKIVAELKHFDANNKIPSNEFAAVLNYVQDETARSLSLGNKYRNSYLIVRLGYETQKSFTSITNITLDMLSNRSIDYSDFQKQEQEVVNGN